MKTRVMASVFFGVAVFVFWALILNLKPNSDWFSTSLISAIIGGISFFLGSLLRNIK